MINSKQEKPVARVIKVVYTHPGGYNTLWIPTEAADDGTPGFLLFPGQSIAVVEAPRAYDS